MKLMERVNKLEEKIKRTEVSELPVLIVKEIDGAPLVNKVTVIRVSNGKLTDDGNGQVTITIP